MAVWPATLPQKFLLGSIDERLPAVARFQTDAGPAKTRRIFANASRHFDWSISPLSQTQRDTLDDFFIATLMEGSLEFDHVDPSGGLAVEFRFLSPLRYSAGAGSSGKRWNVSAQIEILP